MKTALHLRDYEELLNQANFISLRLIYIHNIVVGENDKSQKCIWLVTLAVNVNVAHFIGKECFKTFSLLQAFKQSPFL